MAFFKTKISFHLKKLPQLGIITFQSIQSLKSLDDDCKSLQLLLYQQEVYFLSTNDTSMQQKIKVAKKMKAFKVPKSQFNFNKRPSWDLAKLSLLKVKSDCILPLGSHAAGLVLFKF